jgi:hypothetical protein
MRSKIKQQHIFQTDDEKAGNMCDSVIHVPVPVHTDTRTYEWCKRRSQYRMQRSTKSTCKSPRNCKGIKMKLASNNNNWLVIGGTCAKKEGWISVTKPPEMAAKTQPWCLRQTSRAPSKISEENKSWCSMPVTSEKCRLGSVKLRNGVGKRQPRQLQTSLYRNSGSISWPSRKTTKKVNRNEKHWL